MLSVTDPSMSDKFASAMEEIQQKHLKAFADITDMTAEFSQSHKQFVISAIDACLKKCRADETMFETIQAFKKELEWKQVSLTEKQHAISEVVSEIQDKEMQKDDIMQKIQKLKEEQTKRRELIVAQNKANKDRLKNLQKARYVFQDSLGLEIRSIAGKTDLKGEKLFQFVFRNIDPANEDSPYVVTMGMNENRQYQVVSSDPPLDCLPVLESRLQETNNLAAFLANIRREFISQARC
ncbi:kinetochore protein Spc25 [Salarias fasciatus]|uniref:Kinetochore protein SPC25 n=1 Tax=Salarias fasciatus TaxID=181472 RepID=A0A672IZF1_SALFA|nr:kinetochore protein Spc25 [Salarias fasciatus]